MSKMRLFLTHWNKTEAADIASSLIKMGQDVIGVESSDGARAVRLIKETIPDTVVVYLARLPSHGLETARALRSVKWARTIPIVFVAESGETHEKAKLKVADAIYAASSALKAILARASK